MRTMRTMRTYLGTMGTMGTMEGNGNIEDNGENWDGGDGWEIEDDGIEWVYSAIPVKIIVINIAEVKYSLYFWSG